jgi:hypothetical protein
MKMLIMTLLSFATAGCVKSQNAMTQQFLKTFRQIDSFEIVDMAKVANEGVKMSKQEALAFVYGGDEALLTCKQRVVNMETEKSKIVEEVFLPEKCFLINRKDFFVIGHTYYQCEDMNKPIQRTLVLKTLDKDFAIVDSLVVNRADDYNFEITGLYNMKNDRIFCFGAMSASDHDAAIFVVNKKTLVFERLMLKDGPVIPKDDLMKIIKDLGWIDSFFN